ASHGYVVVAPDHLKNTLLDNDTHALPSIVKNRPHDVSVAMDELLRRSGAAGDLIEGMADGARVGVAGHSFGAFTALLLGGARMDLDAYKTACAQHGGLICGGLDD